IAAAGRTSWRSIPCCKVGPGQRQGVAHMRKRRGRGEGSIFQRAVDGLWTASVSMGYSGDGRRKRKWIYGASKGEAQTKLRELQNGKLPDAGRMTVGDHIKVWLLAIKPNVAAHTYLPYERDCTKHITPKLGGVKLSQLTALHIQNFYGEMAAEGVSAAM